MKVKNSFICHLFRLSRSLALPQSDAIGCQSVILSNYLLGFVILNNCFLDSHGRLRSLRVTLSGKKSVSLSNYLLGFVILSNCFLDSHGRLRSLRVTLSGKKSVIPSNYFLEDCHSEQLFFRLSRSLALPQSDAIG